MCFYFQQISNPNIQVNENTKTKNSWRNPKKQIKQPKVLDISTSTNLEDQIHPKNQSFEP